MSDQDPNAFVPPPPPAGNQTVPPPIEGPVMSTGQTLVGIFFEPGETFASFRNKPRFLVAMLIAIFAYMSFFIVFTERIGFEKIMRAAQEKNPGYEQMSAEQREQQAKMSSLPIVKIITYAITPVFFVIVFGIGGGLYLLGSAMMGGRLNYWQALGVWVYSTLPPLLIGTVLNFVLFFFMDPDTLDLVSAQRRGLARANLAFLVNAKDSPQLATILGSFDILMIYGVALAAIGLRKAGKLSSGSAWAIALVIFIIGATARLVYSFFGGAS